ncbi:MAG: glycosyltransferase family 2 protein [Bacteroidota bacterium]
MKVSIITVSYNSASCIKSCIDSILSQDYPNIEYIIIDGASTDGTVDIIRSYGEMVSRFISEPDQGIYDAMNKGVKLAQGDIVGLLNSDDLYANSQVISRVVQEFQSSQADTVYGDLVYIQDHNMDQIVRYYPGVDFHPNKLRKGMMPPHPTFFVKRHLYETYGLFNTQYAICADFDFMVRLFHKHEVSYSYIPEVMVKMRTGGSSTQGLKSTLTINQEMLQSCRSHGIQTNLPMIYSKYFSKVFQLVKKPS